MDFHTYESKVNVYDKNVIVVVRITRSIFWQSHESISWFNYIIINEIKYFINKRNKSLEFFILNYKYFAGF